jgi:hypothetical protein
MKLEFESRLHSTKLTALWNSGAGMLSLRCAEARPDNRQWVGYQVRKCTGATATILSIRDKLTRPGGILIRDFAGDAYGSVSAIGMEQPGLGQTDIIDRLPRHGLIRRRACYSWNNIHSFWHPRKFPRPGPTLMRSALLQ